MYKERKNGVTEKRKNCPHPEQECSDGIMYSVLFASQLTMKRFFLVLAPLLLLALQHLTAQPALRINEFMASNTATIADPDFGETGDWIELFNAGPTTVDLGGYSITDDLMQPAKWILPAGTMLPADSFLLVWADDAGDGLHASFKLSGDGEAIGLYDAAGTALDAVVFEEQAADVSFGRLAGSPDVWRYMDAPTPGAPNAATGFTGFSEPVSFSVPGGFYAGAASVTLSTNSPQDAIRYTTDGSVPTEASHAYTGPITILSTTAIRAAVFQAGFLPGPVATQTYFIDEPTELPVISLATDPANLWSDETGIYVAGINGVPGQCVTEPRNWNNDWERPANMEFFESDHTQVVNQVVGLKIFGGCSRDYDQKSLSVHARSGYGKGKLVHRFFSDKDIDEFDSLVLRNSGQDWYRTMFRDGMIQTVISKGIDIDYQAYRPAVVFVNGEYFGIHNIREKLNAAFLEGNHGYKEDQIDFLEFDGVVIRGDSSHYNAMIDFISTHDMSREENMGVVNTLMDLDRYLDYVSAEIYIANADWPSGNNKFWRPKTGVGQWRWMIFDTDLSFGGAATGKFDSNTVAQATDPDGPFWPNPPWSTLLFRSLLENERFKNQFVQRIASHINITFDSTYVHHVIDSLQAKIANEIPRHKARWPESIGFNTPWPIHIERLIEFPIKRPAYLRDYLVDHFKLSGTTTLKVTTIPAGAGKVFVSDVAARSADFSGIYFQQAPIELRAEAQPGYRFTGWSGDLTATADSVEIQLSQSSAIDAGFEPIGPLDNESIEIGHRFDLGQNFPNPVSSFTTIPYEISRASPVSIRVFDMLGREVETLVDVELPPGKHEVLLNGSKLASGVYMYELRAGGHVDRKKLVVAR